ncbi:MAG: cobalt-precorrin-5B (C(1))-methyltransferase CbiD [Desulfitobacteriaceae bacterium]|nr:cobalt-precorrin-5B (C(1))-methyltransferase CbiD [Clostridia bacterium]MDD4346157.1 cobalt-precorrin-5B (C(1))-methyltransferase CbiD [Desulfitobacteriaceae bacterium]MDD4400620.1 cobalt-precorrin-5B (C(1))-methyltransferase CbiD [Desulfitobacteriaceae bacterium]
MELGSRWVNGKEMRRGFTTGTAAAAAAKAATTILFSKTELREVEIQLPSGLNLRLPVKDVQLEAQGASCAVKKDAGDDPDITNGVNIYAQARVTAVGIELKTGPGIGIVTKAGLAVAVGRPAINPMPRRMIMEAIRQALPPGKGVEVVLSIPQGEKLARKTFNLRLGIEGGISILGTTGIVEPMSEKAWQDALRLELQVLAARGENRVILVPGNYGRDFAINHLELPEKCIVKMSNFVGFALKTAVELGFTEILLVGDLGKLIKVAAGIFYTHSSVADARMEILAAYLGLFGAGRELIGQVLAMNTTSAVLEMLPDKAYPGLWEFIARRISQKSQEHAGGKMKIGTILFANAQGVLAMDRIAGRLWRKLKNEP